MRATDGEACCAMTVDIVALRVTTVPPATLTPAFVSWLRSSTRLPALGWATYHDDVRHVSKCTGNGDSGPTCHGTDDDLQPLRVRVEGRPPTTSRLRRGTRPM